MLKRAWTELCRLRRVIPSWLVALLYCVFGASLPLMAAILPEDRGDMLYHRYDGGGVEVDGMSYLVRKSLTENTSVVANYYTDSISSASVDVQTFASPYNEQRTQISASADYLHENSLMSLSYTNSDESDYQANTYTFSISHDMFGELTTVSLGYSFGEDTVMRNDDKSFEEHADRRNYRLGLSQILTKNLLAAVSYEAVTEEGYLKNPYRPAVHTDRSDPNCNPTIGGVDYCLTNEIYPGTRSSNAVGLRVNYFLPYRAALKGFVRYHEDNWGIESHTYEIGYTQPLFDQWIFDVHYRYYDQTSANFYANSFDMLQKYMGRDKELSTFNSETYGFGVSYEFMKKGWWIFDKGSFNVNYDFISFEYDDFNDIQYGLQGSKPYSFDTDVLRLYLSVWY